MLEPIAAKNSPDYSKYFSEPWIILLDYIAMPEESLFAKNIRESRVFQNLKPELLEKKTNCLLTMIDWFSQDNVYAPPSVFSLMDNISKNLAADYVRLCKSTKGEPCQKSMLEEIVRYQHGILEIVRPKVISNCMGFGYRNSDYACLVRFVAHASNADSIGATEDIAACAVYTASPQRNVCIITHRTSVKDALQSILAFNLSEIRGRQVYDMVGRFMESAVTVVHSQDRKNLFNYLP